MNTSYIQLSASLGTLGKEIVKAAHQVSVEMRQKEQDVRCSPFFCLKTALLCTMAHRIRRGRVSTSRSKSMAENIMDSSRNCLHLQDVQMKRKDYELSAAASLAERVIQRARQMLANKQILMEDKKAEVIDAA